MLDLINNHCILNSLTQTTESYKMTTQFEELENFANIADNEAHEMAKMSENELYKFLTNENESGDYDD